MRIVPPPPPRNCGYLIRFRFHILIAYGTTPQAGRWRVRLLEFPIDLILSVALWPWGDSASNRNEYQESSWGKERLACKADNLNAICEPTLYKMWELYSSADSYFVTTMLKHNFLRNHLIAAPDFFETS
jgi:hypothetical protein